MNKEIRLTVDYNGNLNGYSDKRVGFIDINNNYVDLYFTCNANWNYDWFAKEVLSDLIENDVIITENPDNEYNFQFRRSFNVRDFISLMKLKNYKFSRLETKRN